MIRIYKRIFYYIHIILIFIFYYFHTFAEAKPPQLLTGEEENAIIDKIHEQQLLYDCWESIDIRNYASEIYRKKLLLKKLSHMIR